MTRPRDKSQDKWTLKEQIAFECALAQDEREEWETLKRRDQAIAETAASSGSAENGRSALARFWLHERLRQEPSLAQAAESVCQSISFSAQILCLIGGAIGFSLAFAALAYTGDAPINVSAFFGLFILLQAIVALVLLLPFLLPAALKDAFVAGPIFGFARGAFAQILKWAQTFANRFLEAQKRNEVSEIAGIARSRLALHRRLFRWLAFSKLQSASLFFNLGALAALLVAVAFSDRAFGWQTTLDVPAEGVHALTRTLALPWSWFYGEGEGYPTVSDVKGSRIVLKEGIRSLETANLAAWWRFLALGIVFYGILPRLLLRVIAAYQLRRAVRDYDFNHAAAERLFERISPEMHLFEVEAVARSGAGAGVIEKRFPAGPRPAESQQSVRCLVSEDLAATIEEDALRDALADRWNLRPENVSVLTYELGGIGRLEEVPDAKDQYAIVFESWMPPIKETERQIKSLRSLVGERVLIRIVPLGLPQPGEESISLHAADSYRSVWDAFVRGLGDPYLILDNSPR